MNPGKEAAVRRTLARWRDAAGTELRLQWRAFLDGAAFSEHRDASGEHRKATGEARGRLVSVLALRGERKLAPAKEKLSAKQRREMGERGETPPPKDPRRIIPLAPGSLDPMEPHKEALGAARVQMVRAQVVGTLRSWLSNCQNEFREAVNGSSLDELTRHMLHSLNRREAWLTLDKPEALTVERPDGSKHKIPIPTHIRQLALAIFRAVCKRHNLPATGRFGMTVDQRGVIIQPKAKEGSTFPLWLDFSTVDRDARGNFRRVLIPLRTYPYFERQQGQRKLTVQVSERREARELRFGLITDIRPAIAARQADPATAYVAKMLEVNLDFGLKALFATDRGDLLGRGFLERLKHLDGLIQPLVKHLQRSGLEPRQSKRYCALVERIRGFARTEIKRVLNRLVGCLRPGHLVLERLNFQNPDLSKRMNRLVQNCGRGIIRAKLKGLEEEFGVTSEEVNPAYTSQTCSNPVCGYVDRRNRREQARFRCLWCGSKIHADVNAGRMLGSRRSVSEAGSFGRTKRMALAEATRRFCERWPAARSMPPGPGRKGRKGPPADPRWTNPYFTGWATGAKSLLSPTSKSRPGQGKLPATLALVAGAPTQ
jgi:putative transposase